MPATTYNKCKELIAQLEKGSEIGFMKLNSLIMVKIGGDPRTTSNTMRVMLDTKLIKDIGHSHFKIL